MRATRAACLVALGAIMVLTTFGLPSASATTLCSLNGSPCPGIEYPSGTSVEGNLKAGTNATFVTSLGTVTCTSSAVAGETTNGGGEGKAVEGTLSTFTFGGCTMGESSCTVTALNLPYGISVTHSSGGSGTLVASDPTAVSTKLECPAITCTYGAKEVSLGATGGNPAVLKAQAISLPKLSGFFCPAEGKWTAEHELSRPKPLFLVAKPAVERKYAPEEGFGIENPGSEEVIHSCAGDPVDCATGNLSESQTDLALHGRGPPLQVTRSYNAQLAAAQAEAGPFGFGWTGPYSAYLTINEGAKTATVHHDNGSAVVFYLVEGGYFPAVWSKTTLVKSGENYVYTLPDQEKLEFNASGQLVKITDRHGNALTLTYKEGKLDTVKDAAGRTLTYAYKEGKVESIKDPMGHLVKYTYESGNLATVTLPGVETARWKLKYDGSHRLTELTDGRGNTTKNEYDASHRVTLQTDPLGRKRKFEYKETSGVRETTIAEPNESKTFEKFNAAGEPTEITRASGTGIAQTTKYEYNAAYQVVKVTDANNHSTTYGYDTEGNKTSRKDPNGNETKWVYNPTHDVIKETTPKGETTTITRNASGDPESIKRPAPGGATQETTFKRAANGDLEEETDPLGRKTKYEYDSYGNQKAEIDPEGDKQTWTYNEDGFAITTVSPRGNEEGAEAAKFETKTERDAQDRVIKVTDPLGHETKYKYDANGNIEVVTNPNAHATTYVYDAADQETEVIAANGDVAKTAYDSMGQVKSKTDGNGKTTKYERNLLGQVTEVIDPLERKTTREYDAAGNLKKVKDAEGRTITYTYDPGDRLTKMDFSEEATTDITYEYGNDNEVTVMKDGTGTTKRTYDELDRLTEVENGNKEVVKYEYDVGNQVTKITYPNGKAVTRGYDKAGRLDKITDWLGKETKFAYNRDSLLKTTTLPSASENKDEYDYDNAGQLTKTTMKRGAETLASLAYTLDNAGQLKLATQTGLPGAEKPEYEYDERERLKKGAGTEFGYDAANNPTKLGASTYSYDNASQLKEGGGVKYTFNSIGQRTKATPASGPATTYGYDQAGNLISVKRPEEGAVKKIEDSYSYDGQGLRASETVSGTTTHLAWDVSQSPALLLYDGTSYYIYGPENLPLEQIAGETATYLHHDRLGSTRLITNASGEAKGKYTYDPFGGVAEHTGAASTTLGFNAQYTNSSTGLIYLRARTYDPTTAQFLSLDPLVAETGAPYSYAEDNPLNAADPTGLGSGTCVQGTLSIPAFSGAVVVCLVTINGVAKPTLTVAGSTVLSRNLLNSIWDYVRKNPTSLTRLLSGGIGVAWFKTEAQNFNELEGAREFTQTSIGFLFASGSRIDSWGPNGRVTTIWSCSVTSSEGFGWGTGTGWSYTWVF
jgi:RHS repeat-associated protein